MKIHKKTLFILCFVILQANMLFAQFKYIETASNFGFQIDNAKTFYSIYPDDYTFTLQCKKQENCSNKTPEETLISLFSSDNYAWEQSNYSYKIDENKEKFSIKKRMDIKSNYFKLIRKLEFSIGNEDYSIIKYHISENNKLKPYASLFKKINNNWLICFPENSVSKIYIMFMSLSDKALDGIFLKKETNVSYFDNKVKELYSGNSFNLTAYMNYTPEIDMSDREEKILIDNLLIKNNINNQTYKSIIRYEQELLNRQNLSLIYTKEISDQIIYNYVDDSYSNAKIDKNLDAYENFNTQNERPILKLNFSYNNNYYSILKYMNLAKAINVNIYLKNEKQNFIIVNTDDSIIKDVLDVMRKVDINFIERISMVEKDKDLIIEDIKNKVKDKNNVINVSLLKKYIK